MVGHAARREPEASASLLARINLASEAEFLTLADPFIENAPWLLGRLLPARPFATPADLLDAIAAVIEQAGPDEQIRLLNGHPELAGREARAGEMTAASTSEQGRLGLDRLDAASARTLQAGNAAYRARFGYPYIIALHRQPDLGAVLGNLESRLQADPDTERLTALSEVLAVIAGRLTRAFGAFPLSSATGTRFAANVSAVSRTSSAAKGD